MWVPVSTGELSEVALAVWANLSPHSYLQFLPLFPLILLEKLGDFLHFVLCACLNPQLSSVVPEIRKAQVLFA